MIFFLPFLCPYHMGCGKLFCWNKSTAGLFGQLDWQSVGLPQLCPWFEVSIWDGRHRQIRQTGFSQVSDTHPGLPSPVQTTLFHNRNGAHRQCTSARCIYSVGHYANTRHMERHLTTYILECRNITTKKSNRNSQFTKSTYYQLSSVSNLRTKTLHRWDINKYNL